MTRDTRVKPTKDNDPGSTGARVYGLVKIGLCIQALDEGRGEVVYIQKPSGEWVRDTNFIDRILDTRVIASGTERDGNGRIWLYNIYAVPRELLRGYEEYVREWVREEDLPSRHLSFASNSIYVEKRTLPDGSIELNVYEKRSDEKEKGY